MSYNPTTWQDGDIITAEKLNNIETGIVNASSGGGPIKQIGTKTILLNQII